MLDILIKKCSLANKLRLLNDFDKHFDFEYNLESITDEAINSGKRAFQVSLLFEYLIEQAEQDTLISWTNLTLNKLGVIDSLEVLHYISKVLLLKPIKNKFAGTPLIKLLGIKSSNEITYINSNLNLFPSEFASLIMSFYKLNEIRLFHRSHSKWQHSKSYINRIACIETILKCEILSDQTILERYMNAENENIDYLTELEHLKGFKELSFIFHSDKKENLINNLIPLFINDTLVLMNNYAKSIKENTLLNLFKNIQYLDPEFLKTYFEKDINTLSTSLKLKMWVYDIIEYFDFHAYCAYYFTLNSVERSIFNKKAKAVMGEVLKLSMLKQREPWVFEAEDGEMKKYLATWRSIWFDDGEIRFCIDNNSNFSKRFIWEFSEEKFNLLFDYISGRRLKDLTVWVKNSILVKVDGLEDLEEIIWKVQMQKEIETGAKIGTKSSSTNRIPINMILRNQCIQLLNQFQINELEPTRVIEKIYNHDKDRLSVDISLLYSIPINKHEIAIIWESLELEKSKATHIFKCNRDEYGNIFSDIEFYLQSKLHVRSSLNSNSENDIERQKKMKYLCKIDHDNFDFSKWEKSLCEALPELATLCS